MQRESNFMEQSPEKVFVGNSDPISGNPRTNDPEVRELILLN